MQSVRCKVWYSYNTLNYTSNFLFSIFISKFTRFPAHLTGKQIATNSWQKWISFCVQRKSEKELTEQFIKQRIKSVENMLLLRKLGLKRKYTHLFAYYLNNKCRLTNKSIAFEPFVSYLNRFLLLINAHVKIYELLQFQI